MKLSCIGSPCKATYTSPYKSAQRWEWIHLGRNSCYSCKSIQLSKNSFSFFVFFLPGTVQQKETVIIVEGHHPRKRAKMMSNSLVERWHLNFTFHFFHITSQIPAKCLSDGRVCSERAPDVKIGHINHLFISVSRMRWAISDFEPCGGRQVTICLLQFWRRICIAGFCESRPRKIIVLM